MLARILGTTAFALVLAGPAAAGGMDPAGASQSMGDNGMQSRAAQDRHDRSDADPHGEGLHDLNIAPQSMNPRGLMPTARPDADDRDAMQAGEPKAADEEAMEAREPDAQVGVAPVAPQSMNPLGLYPTAEGEG